MLGSRSIIPTTHIFRLGLKCARVCLCVCCDLLLTYCNLAQIFGRFY